MKNKFFLSLVVLALLCVAGWAAYGRAQRSSAARQAFEYKLVVYIIEGQKVSLYEDTKLQPAGSAPFARSNELGAQGWELAGTTATSSDAHLATYSYWFRRAK